MRGDLGRSLLTLVGLFTVNLLPGTGNGGYIPPGPKFKCPTLAQIWPCVCLSSNDEGLSLQCQDVSLATLSTGLAYTLQKILPIESLHILNLNTENLYGPLFQKFNVTKLIIEDSPIKTISADFFYYLRHILKDLQLIKTSLLEYDNIAFQELKKLESLTIDQHFIRNLTVPLKGLDNLKALRVSNGNITEISKVTFTALGRLNRLDLHKNHLKDIPKDALQQQKNLEFFDISYNNFTKLDPNYFNHLTKLTWFNGSHNQIPEFKRGAFARNNFLRVIHMTHNKLTKLDALTFRGMRLLRRLYVSDNQISEVGRSVFDAINKVGTIDLSRNRLKVVDYQMFSNLGQAEILDISQNEITEVKREAFHDISYVLINMSYNQISTFEKNSFVNCVNITVLDLSYNQLQNFTRGTFDEFSYPTELRLEFNQLTSLGVVPLKTFHGIKTLNVSYNQLDQIPKNTFPKLYELHTVDLSHNDISKIHPAIFTTLFSLRHLDLSYNNMTQLRGSTFGTIPTLIDLNVSNNRLSTVSSSAFSQLASLRHLDTSNNQITSIFQISPSLSSLDLSNNEISALTKAWPVMNSLLQLDLNGNQIQDRLEGGSFANLGSLQDIKLARNNMTQIPLSALSAMTIVQRIDLSGNAIRSLRKGALGRLPVLFNVDLSDNGLTSIEEKAFEGLLQLQGINLSRNNLSSLVIGSLKSLVSLKVLNLSRNSIERTDNGTQCVFEENLSLETLDLSYNNFHTVTPLTFPSKEWTPYQLSTIDLSHNFLSILTKDFLIGTKKLRQLNLSSNRIVEIRPSVLGNLSNLEVLDLSNNSLTYLDGKSLGPPLKLRELNLERNRLRRFPLEVLHKAPLTIINLKANTLATFDTEFVAKIQNGSRVLLNQNQIICDCRLIPLVRFFNDFRPKLSNYSQAFYEDYLNFECSLSRGGNVSHLATLREGDLQCDHNKDYLAPHVPASYDLEIRSLEQQGNQIEIRWRVRSKKDITGFRLGMIGRSNEELWMKTYAYNVRSAQADLFHGTISICIWSITTKVEGIYNERLKICETINKDFNSNYFTLAKNGVSNTTSISFVLKIFSLVSFYTLLFTTTLA